MRNRLPRLSACVLAAACSATDPTSASPFDHADLGKCFRSADAFLRSAIGDAALADPNISRTSKDSWTWIVDQTASKNYTWYLLEAAGERVCLRIFVPAASSVQLLGKGRAARVEAYISPETELPSKLVELRPTPSGEKFRAARCSILERSASQGSTTRRPVPCEQLFD